MELRTLWLNWVAWRKTSCILVNTHEIPICYANTLGNVVDLLRKISKRDIQNGDQEILPMKQHFIIAREKIRVFYPAFYCILVAILVCSLSDSIIFGLQTCLRNMRVLNVVFPETFDQFFTRFYMEFYWRRTEILFNGSVQLNMLVAMPMSGKIYSRTKKALKLNLGKKKFGD